MATGFTLTTAGAAEIEAAYQSGNVVKIKAVAIGNGGGKTLPATPDKLAAVTALFGEFGRESLIASNNAPGFISGEIYIDCKDYPGETLRELGWISESGTLIAYGVYPDSYLPGQTDSVIKEFIITMALELTHASSVTLVVNPDRALLTQDRADARYLQRTSNLADITDPAAARQALKLGNSAVLDVGTTENTVAAGDDRRITGALQAANNLSDVIDRDAARNYLGAVPETRTVNGEPLSSDVTISADSLNAVTSIRAGAATEYREREVTEYPPGFMTTWGDYGGSNYWIRVRPIQYLIGGIWYNVEFE